MKGFYSIFCILALIQVCMHSVAIGSRDCDDDTESDSPTILEMLQRLASEKDGQYTTFSNLLLQLPKLKSLFAGDEAFEDKNSSNGDPKKKKKYEMILFMPSNVAVANRGSLESFIFKNAILYHIVRTKISRESLNEAAEKGRPVVLETALSGTNSFSENSQAVRLPLGMAQRLILNGPRSISPELSELVNLKADRWSVQYGLLPEATVLSSQGWECSNGLILPIDVFMLPPVDFVVTLASLRVSAFIRLLSSAGMGTDLPPGALIGKPGTTLFLPIQEALMKEIETLQGLSKKDLDALLKRHIIFVEDSSPIYLNGRPQKIKAASGDMLYIEPAMNSATEVGIVNGQKILYGNVLLSNGVAHIIDGIIPTSNEFLQKCLDESQTISDDNSDENANAISGTTQETASSPSASWSGSSAFLFAGALLAVLFIL